MHEADKQIEDHQDPEVTGSTPRAFAVGTSRGTAINMAGSVSIKHPRISSRPFEMIRNLTGPTLRVAIRCKSCAAVPSETNT